MRLITQRICRKGKDWSEKGLSENKQPFLILVSKNDRYYALTAQRYAIEYFPGNRRLLNVMKEKLSQYAKGNAKRKGNRLC